MKHAVGYCRCSSFANVDGDSFVRQAQAIKRYAAANELEIVRCFEERGVPGKTEWEHRPAWVEMIESLNGCRTVVIERLDRLARDLMVQEHILADLKERGIEIISVAEPDLGSDDPTRVLMRHILGAISQYEKHNIVNKLRGARERKRAATGSCEGRKPFGDRPGEEAAIETMRELRGKGLTYEQIADSLNLNHGHNPTRTGKPWHASVVHRVLTREA